MDTEHTPEPWTFGEQGDANQFYLAAGRRWVLGLIHNGEMPVAAQRANLLRITACVNACQSIAEPDIAIPKARAALGYMAEYLKLREPLSDVDQYALTKVSAALAALGRP